MNHIPQKASIYHPLVENLFFSSLKNQINNANKLNGHCLDKDNLTENSIVFNYYAPRPAEGMAPLWAVNDKAGRGA